MCFSRVWTKKLTKLCKAIKRATKANSHSVSEYNLFGAFVCLISRVAAPHLAVAVDNGGQSDYGVNLCDTFWRSTLGSSDVSFELLYHSEVSWFYFRSISDVMSWPNWARNSISDRWIIVWHHLVDSSRNWPLQPWLWCRSCLVYLWFFLSMISSSTRGLIKNNIGQTQCSLGGLIDRLQEILEPTEFTLPANSSKVGTEVYGGVSSSGAWHITRFQSINQKVPRPSGVVDVINAPGKVSFSNVGFGSSSFAGDPTGQRHSNMVKSKYAKRKCWTHQNRIFWIEITMSLYRPVMNVSVSPCLMDAFSQESTPILPGVEQLTELQDIETDCKVSWILFWGPTKVFRHENPTVGGRYSDAPRIGEKTNQLKINWWVRFWRDSKADWTLLDCSTSDWIGAFEAYIDQWPW